MGSSRGSFTAIRFPLESISVSPKPLYTLSPIAPAILASRKMVRLFSRKSGASICSQSKFTNNPKRVGAFSFMFFKHCSRYIPRKPLRLTIKAMFKPSISAVSLERSLTGISNWWLCTSTKGNLERLSSFDGTTNVDFGLYSSISIS